MTLLKLDYEGTILLRALNNTNGNDNIETPRLIQRQRDIIRSESSIWLVFAAAALMGLVNSWKRQELVLDLAFLWPFMSS